MTQSELTTTLQSVVDQLDTNFNDMHMSMAVASSGTMPLSPNDSGFTKDELQQQLTEVGSSDSKRTKLISKIIQNFDSADINDDGKVNVKEATAYD